MAEHTFPIFITVATTYDGKKDIFMIDNLIYAQAVIEGRCVDLLLEEEDLIRGFQNAINNPSEIPISGQCWVIKKPEKCSLLGRILNKCCDCD